MEEYHPNILLCVSGSVAAVKAPELWIKLSDIGKVKIVASKSGLYFMKRSPTYNNDIWTTFCVRGGLDDIYVDEDEWNWEKIGDAVLHIALSQWADVILLAPASADTLTKASLGICDNLLLSILRARDMRTASLVAPAMNTVMWNHPTTEPSLQMLTSWHWRVISPQVKRLACDVVGMGAMAAVDDIVDIVKDVVEPLDISGNRSDVKLTSQLPLPKYAKEVLLS